MAAAATNRRRADPGLGARVTTVETELARFEERLKHVDNQLHECLVGVRELLARDGLRQPTNWRSVWLTAVSIMGGVGIIAGFVWWFVAVSPAVSNLADALRNQQESISRIESGIPRHTRDMQTGTQALIDCLRAEIANAHIGYICAHPGRGDIRARKLPPHTG